MKELERLITASDVWWGFSDTHGWLVRDPEDPRNQSRKVTIFLRASDWSEVHFAYFGCPAFDSHTTRLDHLPDDDRRARDIEILRRHIADFLERKNDLRHRARDQHAKELAAATQEAENRRQADLERARQLDQAIAAGTWVFPSSIGSAVRPAAASVRPARHATTDRNRAQQIRSYCAARGIDRLLHFTQCKNLAGIWEDGLVPRATLEAKAAKAVFNDVSRFDNHTDAVCVSIGFPHYQMFYRYRCASPQVEWAVLELRPEVLWELPCAFCWLNASDSRIKRMPLAQLQEPAALERMLVEPSESGPTRRSCGLPDCYPTDPQAEVLVFDNIPLPYIRAVHVRNIASRPSVPPPPPSIQVEVSPRYFSARCDYERWSRPAVTPAE